MKHYTLDQQADFIRQVELRIAKEYNTGKMRTPIHLCLGQEKICVAVCAALKPTDALFAYYRSHGWYLAKGGDLNKLIAELYGKSNGCSTGIGGSMHLIDLEVGFQGSTAIVGAQLPHAVGYSLAAKLKGEDTLTVCVFGDGASEQGVFMESLMFAALHKLKILFICMNDGLAVNVPLKSRQERNNITARAASFGIISSSFEGAWDLMSLHQRVQNIINCIRNNEGPELIEFQYERLCDHVGPNCDLEASCHLTHENVYFTEIDEAFKLAMETE